MGLDKFKKIVQTIWRFIDSRRINKFFSIFKTFFMFSPFPKNRLKNEDKIVKIKHTYLSHQYLTNILLEIYVSASVYLIPLSVKIILSKMPGFSPFSK